MWSEWWLRPVRNVKWQRKYVETLHTYLLNCVLTYLLTPWCRVLLGKLPGLQLVKKFPAFHGTRRFITALTSVRHLSPEQASRMWVFLNRIFLQGGVVSTSPNPQARGPHLVCCPRLLIQYIRSSPPYWRLFLHPQPEDASCHCDRDPLHVETYGSEVQCILNRAVCWHTTLHKGGKRYSAPLYRHWGFVQAVRPIGGVEV